jgi:hypothetical protein
LFYSSPGGACASVGIAASVISYYLFKAVAYIYIYTHIYIYIYI